MIDLRKYRSGETYLTIADVRDGPLQMTIADVREGKFSKPDLVFTTGDVLGVNATKLKILTRAYGFNSKTLIGKDVKLVQGETTFQGAPQESIIVNPVSAALTAAEKAAAAGELPASGANKMDDDIPF
jgi:hypothetical protein